MLSKYRQAVEALSPPTRAQVCTALYIKPTSQSDFYPALEAARVTQADLVMVLLQQIDSPNLGETHRQVYRQDIAKLIGKPIEVGPPPQITPLPVKTTWQESNPADARIIVRVERNPRLPTTDSFHRFKIFQIGRTIGEAIRRGVTRKDVREALANNWVVLS